MILTVCLNNGLAASAEADERIDGIYTKVCELWKLRGLEPGNPVTHTTDKIETLNGDIDLDITGDCETTSTVTRNGP